MPRGGGIKGLPPLPTTRVLPVAELIIVTGSPGVGKSSVSEALSNLLGCELIESSVFLRSVGALRLDPTGRSSEVVDESRASESIKGFILGRSGCFVVSTLHPTLWLNGIQEHVLFVVLLRCHPRVLFERLESRGWGRAKVLENVLAESFNVIAEELLDYEDLVLEVDSSGKSLDEVVDEILSKLELWDTGIRIDWLSLDPSLIEFVTKLVHELDLYKERLGV
jgi:adenylate kinase